MIRIAVNRFLGNRCAPQLGAFNLYGPLDAVREAHFGSADAEIEEYAGGASMMRLGIRMTNERGDNGDTGWVIHLRSGEVMLPASAETRPWTLLVEVNQLLAWAVDGTGIYIVRDALAAVGKNCR